MVLGLPCPPHHEADSHVVDECAARVWAEAHVLKERTSAGEAGIPMRELEIAAASRAVSAPTITLSNGDSL